jgi:RNA polymerase sigma-70 factor (ECF subfamily)
LQIFWHTDHNHPAQLEETIIQNEANSGLLQAVQALNEKHRLPVILRYYHDLSVNDIAQILDIPAGTVHSRLNKARQQLKSSVVRFNQP